MVRFVGLLPEERPHRHPESNEPRPSDAARRIEFESAYLMSWIPIVSLFASGVPDPTVPAVT